MRKLQYAILICCLLCVQLALAQRRFEVSERWEYRLSDMAGFSYHEMENHTDAFWGLHASQYIGSKKTDDYIQFATKNQKLYDKDLILLSKDGVYYYDSRRNK